MSTYTHQIALLGGGTIGLSMTALHLRRLDTKVTLYDPRPDFEDQVRTILPTFLDSSTLQGDSTSTNIIDHLLSINRLAFAKTIEEAVQSATIIQEQSPEVTSSKQTLWKEVTQYASDTAQLWSSSSGIAASAQGELCNVTAKERLLVAHPFNPPHLMPLIEIVPGPHTLESREMFVKQYFSEVPGPTTLTSGVGEPETSAGQQYYRPVVLRKEVPGFVGNRLAFALLREACYLVGEGVISVKDLDQLLMASLGPRWAGSGVFESYHAGGGEGGIGAFLQKLAPTMKDVWGGLGNVYISVDGNGDGGDNEAWREAVVQQTEQAYGPSTAAESRRKKEVMLRGVIELQQQSQK